MFLQSGTEPQSASSLIILHLGHTSQFENRLQEALSQVFGITGQARTKAQDSHLE